MKIELSQDDFGTLCICALRYCHGRRSYMPSRVQGIVAANLKHLSLKDLHVITKDEDFQERFALWGDDCDKEDWERFYKIVKDYKMAGKLSAGEKCEYAERCKKDNDKTCYCNGGQTDCAWK